jgi:hypothetical protein
MRNFRTNTGPFSEGLFIPQREIENACLDELEKAGLLPAEPGPIRIDRFIKKRFGVEPTYEPLPEGILGFTHFGSTGVQAVVIASALADEGTKVAERRLNSTLAHEAGHGLFHAHLFALQNVQRRHLFDEEAGDKPRILCRDAHVGGKSRANRYDGRWWELHANQAIGGLLLPRSLALKSLAGLLQTSPGFGVQTLEAQRRREAILLLSEVFDVNPVVAEIRLEDLFPVASGTQLTL